MLRFDKFQLSIMAVSFLFFVNISSIRVISKKLLSVYIGFCFCFINNVTIGNDGFDVAMNICMTSTPA